MKTTQEICVILLRDFELYSFDCHFENMDHFLILLRIV